MAKVAVTPTIIVAEFMLFHKKFSSKKVVLLQPNVLDIFFIFLTN